MVVSFSTIHWEKSFLRLKFRTVPSILRHGISNKGAHLPVDGSIKDRLPQPCHCSLLNVLYVRQLPFVKRS